MLLIIIRKEIVSHILSLRFGVTFILFLALMPNFIDLETGSTSLQLMILGTVLIGINIIWQVGLTLAADRARSWLDSPQVQRAVTIGAGVIFLIFAAAMMWVHVRNT